MTPKSKLWPAVHVLASVALGVAALLLLNELYTFIRRYDHTDADGSAKARGRQTARSEGSVPLSDWSNALSIASEAPSPSPARPGRAQTHAQAEPLSPPMQPPPPEPCLPMEGIAARFTGESVETDENGIVTAWRDTSGFLNDLFPEGAAPVRVMAGPRLPGVKFDGIRQRLIRRAGVVALSFGNRDRSVFMVVRYDGKDWAGGFSYGDVQPGRGFSMETNQQGRISVHALYVPDLSGGNPVTGNGYIVQDAVVCQSHLTLAVNGAIVADAPFTHSTGSDFVVVGGSLDDTRHIPVIICEIIAYNRALPMEERLRVWQYLAKKYAALPGQTPMEAPPEPEPAPAPVRLQPPFRIRRLPPLPPGVRAFPPRPGAGPVAPGPAPAPGPVPNPHR